MGIPVVASEYPVAWALRRDDSEMREGGSGHGMDVRCVNVVQALLLYSGPLLTKILCIVGLCRIFWPNSMYNIELDEGSPVPGAKVGTILLYLYYTCTRMASGIERF